jgi:hypothetical protein
MSSAPEVALSEILKSTDVAAASAANARIVGDDPVIPTRYRIGAAGSAVIAAAGLARVRTTGTISDGRGGHARTLS